MAKVGTAEYDVEISKAKLKGEVDHASKTIEQGLGGSAQKVKSQFSGIGGSIVLGLGLKAAIGEFEEAQKVGAQTAAVIKSTGNAAEVSAAQQDKMVQSLSDLAAIDDEVIAGGANVLRTFTNIKGAETFEKALGAATDLSAAMGTDLQGSIVLVGKALNDPVKGLAALTRVGVSFTEQQKEQIKAMVAAGDAAGAQKLILAELSKEFGGSAEANATSTAKMKVAFGNAAEAAGSVLAPALEVAGKAAEFLGEGFTGLNPTLQATVTVGATAALIGPKIASGLSAAADAAGSARSALRGSVSEFGALNSAALAAGVGVTAFGLTLGVLENMSKFEGDASGLADDLVQLGSGLASVDQGIGEIGNITTLADEFKEVADNTNFATVAGKSFKSIFGAGGLDALTFPQQAKNDIAALDKALAEAVTSGHPAEAQAAYTKLTLALIDQNVPIETIVKLLPNYANALDRSNRAAGTAADGADRLSAAQSAQAIATDKAVKAAQDSYTAATALATAEDARNDAIVGVAQAQEAEEQAQASVTQAVRGAQAAQRSLADARRAVGDAEAAVADAIRGEEAARRGLADAEKAGAAVRQAVVDRTADLAQAQREAAGDSDAMREALDGVARAEIDLEARQADSLTAQQDLTDARNDYEHTLRNLSDAAGGAADDVLSAEIRLRRAQESLATLGAPDRNGNVDPVTADDVLAAQIAIRDAERAVRAAQDQAAAAAADLARNQANGVEGSDAVVAASEAVTQARDDETAAHLALEGAVQNVADTQEAADARVVEAHAALTAAVDAVGAANQRIIDARQAVVDAQDATRDAVRGVGDAQANVAVQAQAVIDANAAIVTAKDGVVKAHGDTEGAVRGVAEKTKTLADEQFRADGNLHAYITTLDGLRDRIDPNTPFRRNLDSLIDDLREIANGVGANGSQNISAAEIIAHSGSGSNDPALSGTRSRPQLTVINGLGEGSPAPRPRLRSEATGTSSGRAPLVVNVEHLHDALDLEVAGRRFEQAIRLEAAV